MIYVTDREVVYSWGEMGHSICEVNVLKWAELSPGKPPTYFVQIQVGD